MSVCLPVKQLTDLLAHVKHVLTAAGSQHILIGSLHTVCNHLSKYSMALQAQHVGHWPQGYITEEPSLESIPGSYSHPKVLFCCP